MSLKHLVFIVKPTAGMEREKEIQAAITAHIDAGKYTTEIQHTRFAKHGTQLAAEAAAAGAYAVVAVGGDGSVNDIARGLLGTNTMLAIIPKGSGNGMARTIGIPLNTTEAVKVINAGRFINMDVGFANGDAFISNAGVAFDALISKKFATSERRGFAVYSYLVTKYLWLYKARVFDITVDGKTMRQKVFMINVANGQQFGYNFRIAPMADYTDGILDLIIIRSFPKIFGGLIALRAMKGNITDSRYVTHFRGKEITLSHPDLKLMQTDGDAHPCSNSVTFTIRAGAQKVIVP